MSTRWALYDRCGREKSDLRARVQRTHVGITLPRFGARGRSPDRPNLLRIEPWSRSQSIPLTTPEDSSCILTCNTVQETRYEGQHPSPEDSRLPRFELGLAPGARWNSTDAYDRVITSFHVPHIRMFRVFCGCRFSRNHISGHKKRFFFKFQRSASITCNSENRHLSTFVRF